MANEILAETDFNELLKKLNNANGIISVTVDTVANLSKGLGVLGNQMQEVLQNQEKINDDLGAAKSDIDILRDDVHLSTPQKRKLKTAVDNRMVYLLEDVPEEEHNKYFPAFYSNCWHDINYELNVTTYSDIRRVDFEKAVELANSWEPLGGVQALKSKVDRRWK